MSVARDLDKLEYCSREIQKAATERAPDAMARILDLRQQFSDSCSDLLQSMCEDPRIFENKELFTAMQAALENLRNRMASHQMRWTAERIDADRAAYFAAAQPVQDLLREFVLNVRVFIQD